MNRIEKPPASAAVIGREADDIDVLLHRYFHNELPAPWPALPRGTVLFRPGQRPARSWLSRATLAASVACLLAGSIWFAARPTSSKSGNSAPQEATRRHELHKIRPGSDPLELPARSR